MGKVLLLSDGPAYNKVLSTFKVKLFLGLGPGRRKLTRY
jgi:hypothetical protein